MTRNGSQACRILAGTIPPTSGARKLMDRWLRYPDRSKVTDLTGAYQARTSIKQLGVQGESPRVSPVQTDVHVIEHENGDVCVWYDGGGFCTSPGTEVTAEAPDDDDGSGVGGGGSGGNGGSGGGWPSGGPSGPGGGGGIPAGDNPPAIAPDGIPQDYYDELNKKEKEICYSNKVRCFGVYNASIEAKEWAADNEASGAHNGPQDALRHAMWNAKMAYAYGKAYAKKWGDAHELGSLNQAETNMDLHNNKVGRDIGGSAGRNLDRFPTVEQSILDARYNGKLCMNITQCND